jgi:hypothetical protein
MEKYCIIDDKVTKRGLETLEVFESKEDALCEAEKQWYKMSASEQANTDRFLVALCDVVQNETGKWQYNIAEDDEWGTAYSYNSIRDFVEVNIDVVIDEVTTTVASWQIEKQKDFVNSASSYINDWYFDKHLSEDEQNAIIDAVVDFFNDED